jgi:tetratricopeptide (TPR) repeat protein
MNALPPSQPAADGPDHIAAQAAELLDRRRVERARQLLRPALEQHPHHSGLLYEAARTEVMDDRPETARALLAQLLALDPALPRARFLLFCVELDANSPESAEQLILGLLREYPQEPLYYAYYSRLMLRALDLKKATRLADEALRLAPQHEAALHAKALCDIADGRTGHDSEATIRLLLQHPDDAQTLRLMVTALVHADRPRDALRLARELLHAQPDDADLLEQVKELRAHTHWSLLPLWPMQKWGWTGSVVLWVAVLLVMQLLGRMAPEYSGGFSLFWLAFVIYSWAWPPLLRRLMLWRL